MPLWLEIKMLAFELALGLLAEMTTTISDLWTLLQEPSNTMQTKLMVTTAMIDTTGVYLELIQGLVERL